MRSLTTSQLQFATAAAVSGAGQRIDYLQGDDPETLVQRFTAIVAELAALNDGQAQDWQLVHMSLAGAGDGAPFMLELRWGNNAAANVTAVGKFADLVTEAEEEPGLIMSSGAQSRALQSRARQALLDTVLAGFATNLVAIDQTLLAGGSLGTRFLNALLGEIDRS